MAKRKGGVEIDLKQSKMSVEQALRELKMILEDDMDMLKEKRYYQKPSLMKREHEKKRQATLRRYSNQ